MQTAVIILNVLLVATVSAAIVGMLLFSIAAQERDHATAPVVRPSHKPYPRMVALPGFDGGFGPPSGTGGRSVHLIRSFWRTGS